MRTDARLAVAQDLCREQHSKHTLHVCMRRCILSHVQAERFDSVATAATAKFGCVCDNYEANAKGVVKNGGADRENIKETARGDAVSEIQGGARCLHNTFGVLRRGRVRASRPAKRGDQQQDQQRAGAGDRP